MRDPNIDRDRVPTAPDRHFVAGASTSCLAEPRARSRGRGLGTPPVGQAGGGGEVELPHRWVVERTFGWLGRYRRLARDYEHTTSSSESMVYVASIRRMLKIVAT